MPTIYNTELGSFVQGQSEQILTTELLPYRKKVDLIFTSPPFPLNRKKRYGNLNGKEYIKWLASFAPIFRRYLRKTGSIVLELGNSWEPGKPAMSVLALQALLAFMKRGNFVLCQQFVWYNPARLPSPAQWVNVDRIRVKDAFTHLWWFALNERPKADNRRILKEYSASMRQLLKSGKYNSGARPSEHHIGETSFLNDNRGAIPSNVITVANTQPNTQYLKYCRHNGLEPHPARMPDELAEFFIKFLTEPQDLVLDPFAGSNTTGAVAERLERKWLSIEADSSYIEGSLGRFAPLLVTKQLPEHLQEVED